MKISVQMITSLMTKQALETVTNATEKALKDVTILIAHDVIQESPVITGNNRRSIKYEIEKLGSSIFSTSGYGGFIQTGTVNMPANPYFTRALDKNIHKFPEGIRAELK